MSFGEFKRTVEVGDTVILYVGVTQIYALEVKPKIKTKKNEEVDYVFQTKYGCLKVMDLVGKEFGTKTSLSKGYAHILYPTPELWTITLPHRTQIIYTPDISMIITELEVGSGSIVCEAGTGSGSLSHAFLRTVGPKGHLYTCDFHQNRADLARDEFEQHGFGSRVTVSCRDVCSDGWDLNQVVDAAFLDLPKPWEGLPHAVNAIKITGGRICSFSPCIEQVSRTSQLMEQLGLNDITTVECLQREYQVKNINALNPIAEASNDDTLNGDNSFETKSKKQKLENDEGAEVSKKSEKDYPDKNSHKFKAAIPVLKTPGHTGFLTFATVPPNLNRNFSNVLKDFIEESA